MANSIIRVAYAVLKDHGIDTSEMTVEQVIEMFNKLNKDEKSFSRRQNEQLLRAKGYTDDQISKLSDAEIKIKIDKFEPRRYNSIKGKIVGLKNNEDGTYDIETGDKVEFSSGYQVSFHQSDVNYTDEEYDRLTNEVAARTQSRAYAGVYGEPEVSFRCENLEDALKIAKEFNQESIYDWSNKGQDGEFIFNPFYNPTSGNKIKR